MREYMEADFYTGISASSYVGRIRAKAELNAFARKIAYDHAYTPSSAKNLAKFLKLKQDDSFDSVAVAPSAAQGDSGASGWTAKLMDPEAQALFNTIKGQTSQEILKNFYNSYMAPLGGDIGDRLGPVIKTKQLFSSVYNDKGELVETGGSICSLLGQTDKFGRMDTVANMRTMVEIDPCYIKDHNGHAHTLTQGYSEYYVNFFFPPYTSKFFNEKFILRPRNDSSIDVTQGINTTEDNKTTYSEMMSQAEAQSTLTKNRRAAIDPKNIKHFDPVDMMCARDGFTYRAPGFKAVNDNISFLQFLFEQCTGIVSTYMTEWDLSLYMQEGLEELKKSSIIWLCSRVEEDNPQGLEGEDAFCWGVVNAAVSKVGVHGRGPASQAIWNPGCYFLSGYWWPSHYPDRGDGLPTFWDYAIRGPNHECNRSRITTVRGRIKFEDEQRMAFAGWKSADIIQYYQAFYTSPEDGLSSVDQVYLQEPNGVYKTLEDEIKAVQDALYMDDQELGWGGANDSTLVKVDDFTAAGWEHPLMVVDPQNSSRAYKYNYKKTTYERLDPYDSESTELKYIDYYMKIEGKEQPEWQCRKGKDGRLSADFNSTSNDVSIDQEGNISILGVEIKGSSLLKMFVKKDSIKSQAMGIAAQTKSGFGCLIDNVVEPNPNNPPTDGSSVGILDEVLNSHPDENKHNSNPLGIPRLGPVLFGGPHGNMSSPQTMQAYFEPNNTFLRTIARVEPSIVDTSSKFTSMDRSLYYQGVERQFCFPAGIKEKNTSIGRSPSETLHFMKEGYCDSIKAYIWTWRYKEYQHIHPSISAYAGSSSYTSYSSSWSADFNYDTREWTWSYSTTSSTHYYTSVSVSVNYPTHKGHSAADDRVPDWIRYHVSYGLWDGGYDTVYAGTSSYGGSGYTTLYDGWRSFSCYWWSSGDRIYVEVPRVYRTGSYHQYEQSSYRRPLMHNIPAKIPGKSSDWSKWRLGKYKWAPDPEAHGWYSGKYADYLKNWGEKNECIKRCAQYYTINPSITPEDSFYRMTMPYTGEDFRNHPETAFIWWTRKINGRHNGTHCGTPESFYTWTDRYYPEDEVVQMMLGNGKNPFDWTNIFYCVSAVGDSYNDRITKGPRAIIQIPTRLTERTVDYWELRCYCEHHSCTCHDDVFYYTVARDETYRWIEADLQNAKVYYSSANWSEIYRPDIFANDVMEDVPDEKYRIQFWESSPLQLLREHGRDNEAFQFAGPGYGLEKYEHIYGWGLYLAMPGMDPSYPIPVDKGLGNFEKFEDPNEYLNISHIYNMYGLGDAKTTPIKDLGIFSCQLSDGGPRRPYSNGDIYTTSERCPKVYNTKLMGVPENPQIAAILKSKFPGDVWDQGLYNFLIKMYQSCILFLPCGVNIEGNMQPFTVDIGASVISALKMVKHQRAYLEYTKELFTHTVSAQAIKNILDKSVDRQITLVSNPEEKTTYDPSSIYYSYWIDKAYELYYNAFDESGLLKAFTTRIESIDTFTKSSQSFIATVSGFSTSAENWSFNNFIDCYEVFRVFKDEVNLLDDKLENYFYAYLNVLYEYRKYFVNKRFNKQDGSLWMTRQLESALPLIGASSGVSTEAATPVVTNLEPDINQYIIDMKQVSNSIYKKGEAVAKNEANPLDKISKLYIKVVPATKEDFYEFIDSKRITDPVLKYEKPDPNNKNVTQIAYLRLPIDGTYKLQSKEYLTNDANKSYNDKLLTMVNVGSLSRSDYEIRKKIVDDRIQDCVFQIIWNDSSKDALRDAYLAATKEVDKFEGKQDAARLEYEKQQRIFEDLEVEVEKENKQVDDEYLTAVRTLENALSEAGGTKERWRAKEFYNAAVRKYLTSAEGIVYYDELPKCIASHIKAEGIHDKFVAEAKKDIKDNPLLIITPGEDLSKIPEEQIPKVRYNSFEEYYAAKYQAKEDKEVLNSISESEWGIFSESIYNNWGGKKAFRKVPEEVYAQVEAYVDSTFNDNRDDSEYFYDVINNRYNKYYTELEKCVKNRDDGTFSLDIYVHWDNEEHFRAVAPEILDTVNEFVYAWENLDNFDQDVLDRLDHKNKTYEKNDKRLAAQDKKQKDALNKYNDITEDYNEADKKATDAYQAYQSQGGESETREARIERFTWRQPAPNDDKVPNIIFNLSTGVDPAKLTSAKSEDASVELCRSSKFEDFWAITIPESEQPLDIGFDVGLKIKTYKPKIRSAVQFADANTLTTVAGPFAYSLYPITDAQNGLLTCPGSDLGGLKDVLEGIVM